MPLISPQPCHTRDRSALPNGSQHFGACRPIAAMMTSLAVAAGFLLASTPSALAATPPTAPPATFTATRVFSDANELVWTDASTNEKYFEVETKDGFDKPFVKTWTTFDPAAPPTGKRYSHLIKGLPGGRVFCYRVSAVNDGGRQTTGEKCAAPALPATPTNLTIDYVQDTWVNVSYENSPTWEWSYKLYSREAGSAQWVMKSERSAHRQTSGPQVGKLHSYAGSLTPERYYCFRVTASNSKGESGPSHEACVTTKIRRPAAPTDLRGRSNSPTTVTLNWTDASTTETTNYLRQGNDPSKGDTVIKTWGPLSGAVSYTVTGLAPGTTYTYRVGVLNEGGSSHTDHISVTTQSAPPPPQEVTQSYWVSPYIPFEGTVFWRLYLNPNLPAGAYIKSFQYVVGPDWIMHVMKTGKLYSQCGYADASIPFVGYQNATAEQLNVLYGSSQPKPPLSIEACASSRSGGNLPLGNRILVNVTYVIP